MSSSFALISEDELRAALALWTIKNSRFAPQLGSCGEAAFVQNFAIPETDFESVSDAVSANDTVVTVFKTSVVLQSWQTRCGRERCFQYCKAVEHDVDSLGNIFSITAGYAVLNAD